MKKLLLFSFLLAPLFSSAQKFYVNTSCDRCDLLITKKLNKLGYLTTKDSMAAICKIDGSFQKQRAYMSLKVKQQESGYLKFISKDGTVLDSTRIQKGSAAAINGFNAKSDVVRKILKSDFYAIVKNIASKRE